MMCPVCGGRTATIGTRTRKDGLSCRRRECLSCGHRFTTQETEFDAQGWPWSYGIRRSCPVCGEKARVTNSVLNKNGTIRRHHVCVACGHRFSTREQIIGEDENHAEKNKPDEPAVQRREQRKKSKPYSMSELRIALRIR